MENLIEVLGQESEEYEGLLALSQKKMRIIAGANLEDLQKITDDEQEVVSRLNRLEKRRIEVAADIANVLNKDVETMKLTNLIEMLSARPAEQAALAAVHDRLKSVVREVQRTNEQNRELLEEALELVNFEMNMLQAYKAAPETANYTRSAYNSGAQMGVDSGGFDAKQ
ncbi:MAG: flagellar protein FlgN [Lachnospiraceae bacterium]|jgi:flagellar biosynthesis/type III secretory pathway chaperone|nr:flagellar protein FlgN [Lachnospiraceae bacterium]MCI9231989.1 flagellar protein FlgN [Lachnospiraceae bacterium]MCI9572453.1 flagellar protein FlgN [Lachnospiraceae bacterium]MCI9650793.1 flagellar protein FlgN [Lachnospiraceae bacterium]